VSSSLSANGVVDFAGVDGGSCSFGVGSEGDAAGSVAGSGDSVSDTGTGMSENRCFSFEATSSDSSESVTLRGRMEREFS